MSLSLQATMGKMFEALNVPLEHLDHAMTALKRDSQAGVMGKRGTEHHRVSPAEYAHIDKLFAEVGIPANSKQTVEEMKAVFDL